MPTSAQSGHVFAAELANILGLGDKQVARITLVAACNDAVRVNVEIEIIPTTDQCKALLATIERYRITVTPPKDI